MATVVIYGDFNCPFSAVASSRAAHVRTAGLADVDWHAVEHAPDLPSGGEAVTGSLAAELDREIEQISQHLTDSEAGILTRPSRRPNTALATAVYASTTGEDRHALRQAIFTALWKHDADIGDAEILATLGATACDQATAATWRRAWQSLPQQIVPAMVLPDGYVSRGVDVLTRLGAALDGDRGRLHHQ